MNDLLPLGSIVEIHNKGKYMIIGYLPTNYSDFILYNYVVCDYRGLKRNKIIKDSDFFYIKKEDIDNVLFIGFQNNEFAYFSGIIEDIIISMKDFDNNKITEEDYKKICLDIILKYKKGGVRSEK